jgi:hypothetical protein
VGLSDAEIEVWNYMRWRSAKRFGGCACAKYVHWSRYDKIQTSSRRLLWSRQSLNDWSVNEICRSNGDLGNLHLLKTNTDLQMVVDNIV